MKEYTYNEALQVAAKYGLRSEVKYDMDIMRSHPNDALLEWDILPLDLDTDGVDGRYREPAEGRKEDLAEEETETIQHIQPWTKQITHTSDGRT